LVGVDSDDVLFDIVPMYACHLLLGRPWLYDNHLIYNGYANTYSLRHNGHSLVLAHLPLPRPHRIILGKGHKESLYMRQT